MIFIRILIAVTVYSVILLEIYSGAILGPRWWIIPGGLVISVIMGIAIFGDLVYGKATEGGAQRRAGIGAWALILILSFAMSAFSNYFGRLILPEVLETAQARQPPA